VSEPVPSERGIEIRVPQLSNLFNAIDPSPFHDKDIDPNAEEFIVGWARELPKDAALALVVHLGRAGASAEERAMLERAVHENFRRRASDFRRRLRLLFRRGRTSLLIGLAFLAASVIVSDLLASRIAGSQLAMIVRESVLIGGWVAMWRPLEIFLYDWWPLRSEAQLSDRLAAMPVRISAGE
jgi:hypothetical protein